MADVALMLGSKEVGRFYYEKAGSRIKISASCPYEEGKIYRVYVSSSGKGDDTYLGIMMPEGKRFVIRKEVSAAVWPERKDLKAYIQCSGFHEETDMPLPFSFDHFASLEVFDGESITEMDKLFKASGGLRADFRNKRYYAVEGRPGMEMPVSGLFCLLTYMEYRSKGYWVLCVDENGDPSAAL